MDEGQWRKHRNYIIVSDPVQRGPEKWAIKACVFKCSTDSQVVQIVEGKPEEEFDDQQLASEAGFRLAKRKIDELD
jgi:hypothetical protein